MSFMKEAIEVAKKDGDESGVFKKIVEGENYYSKKISTGLGGIPDNDLPIVATVLRDYCMSMENKMDGYQKKIYDVLKDRSEMKLRRVKIHGRVSGMSDAARTEVEKEMCGSSNPEKVLKDIAEKYSQFVIRPEEGAQP